MSLATNVTDLATRVATESKSIRTLLNGNAVDLSALDTTAKSNLVAAVNEVVAAVAGASGISDSTTSTSTSWSSSKTSTEIASASTADRDRANHTGNESADVLVDGTTNHVFTAADDTKLGGIASAATANQADSYLLDRAHHTGQQESTTISDFNSAVNTLIESVVGAAPEALNTLQEIADALGDDPDFAATITTALGFRVQVDAAQSFTAPQQAQARSNIGAASAADVGDVSSLDAVATFEAGLA